MGENISEQKEVVTEKSTVPQIPMTYALVRYTDMHSEMKTEVLETCIVACEKFPEDLVSAARLIKEQMEQKVCGHWHVIVGESFGFEVTFQKKTILYTFFGGNLAILVWCLWTRKYRKK